VVNVDQIVSDPDEDAEDLACNRTPTKPLPGPLKVARVQIDLADADSAAAFLEFAAQIIRERRKITVTVE
jgi:hypothetical protein